MKAEERHELRDNDLATWLQYGLWNFLKQNGSYVLLVLALGFLGWQLWAMYERKQEIALETAWEDFYTASTGDTPTTKLQKVIETYDIKPVQAQAYLELGTQYSAMLLMPEELDRQKLTRKEALDKSYDAYKEALELRGDDLLVASKAHLGMAAVEEDRGNWDQAKQQYEEMKKGIFAGTAYADLATARLASLNDRRNAPRLAAMMPPPTPAPLPSSLLGPGIGGGLQSLPGIGPQFGPAIPTTGPGSFSGSVIPDMLVAPATSPAKSPAPATALNKTANSHTS